MKRLWSLVLAVCVLISGLAVMGPPVSAAEKKTTKKSIAIVYDNSWSMYADDDGKEIKAWCQALYAVEVFASMMNEGDELRVYPMHEIEAGKKKYDQSKPLKINDPKDAMRSSLSPSLVPAKKLGVQRKQVASPAQYATKAIMPAHSSAAPKAIDA